MSTVVGVHLLLEFSWINFSCETNEFNKKTAPVVAAAVQMNGTSIFDDR